MNASDYTIHNLPVRHPSTMRSMDARYAGVKVAFRCYVYTAFCSAALAELEDTEAERGGSRVFGMPNSFLLPLQVAVGKQDR
jgi:hypothetical protein